jgi:hypothetical protein
MPQVPLAWDGLEFSSQGHIIAQSGQVIIIDDDMITHSHSHHPVPAPKTVWEVPGHTLYSVEYYDRDAEFTWKREYIHLPDVLSNTVARRRYATGLLPTRALIVGIGRAPCQKHLGECGCPNAA